MIALETTIFRYLIDIFPTILVSFIIMGTLLGCGGKVLTYEQQLLGEADSLFHAGNFEFAKTRFVRIRTLKPESPAAKIAQYYLGYINVYYDNPFASPEAALREFRQFVTLYPDDARVDEVNSWIKILTTMQLFEKSYHGTTDSILSLKVQKNISEQAIKKSVSVDSIITLNDIIRKCHHQRDSLAIKNKDLENFILDLERKCQEAGQ